MTILAAALQYKGLIFTLPPPSRHHHIIHLMEKVVGLSIAIQSEQGFISSKGYFVDRDLAGQIALADGQIEKLRWPPELFSEDLW